MAAKHRYLVALDIECDSELDEVELVRELTHEHFRFNDLPPIAMQAVLLSSTNKRHSDVFKRALGIMAHHADNEV